VRSGAYLDTIARLFPTPPPPSSTLASRSCAPHSTGAPSWEVGWLKEGARVSEHTLTPPRASFLRPHLPHQPWHLGGRAVAGSRLAQGLSVRAGAYLGAVACLFPTPPPPPSTLAPRPCALRSAGAP